MISVGLVYYSGEQFLKESIETLLSQSVSHFEILVRDHSDTCFASRFLSDRYPDLLQKEKIKIFTGHNLMHSGGHNFLMTQMRGEVYVCGSVDMEYRSNCLQNIQNILSQNPKISYCTGKILNLGMGTIDSAGLQKNPCFRFVDRGQGSDTENFSKNEVVFGASGALFAIRKKLMAKISLGEKNDEYGRRLEIFDETLHYKNDVDLACRINLLDEQCWYDSSVYALHHRQVGKGKQKSDFSKKSSFVGQQHLFQKYSGTKLLERWKGIICKFLHRLLYFFS